MTVRQSTVVFLLAIFIFVVTKTDGAKFKFPPHRIELLTPKGFKVSVPDVPGATLFAIHINVNEEMEGLDAGEFAKDIVKMKNGRWTYYNREKRLANGDILYYWLYLIVDGLGQQLLNQEYVVSGLPSSPSVTTSTTEPPPDIDVRVTCDKPISRIGSTSFCPGQVLFYDDFSKDLNKWSNEVSFSDLPEADFTIFTKDFDASGIFDGRLRIEPKLLSLLANDTFVNSGSFELRGCTTRVKKNCVRTANWWSILPPIVSSRLTTKNSFSFLYGEVEIRAKLPSGDWIVPEIWLEPKEVFYGSNSGHLHLGKSRGNPSLTDAANNQIGSRLLLQGFSTGPNKTKYFSKMSEAQWSADFHDFKLRWAPDSITFFVDGNEMGQVVADRKPLGDVDSPNPLAPFDREFYLNLGIHVGGREDFPDDLVSSGKAKPWQNNKIKHVLDFWLHKDDWYPSWKSPQHQLLVEYVKVTAL